ncbi:hypothetical protein [Achromobacter phage Motura]|uniref:Uncharacterized protein n=1 Tax=Achromobacter phage Motura TaxID=2591403 RepID=A0A514CSH3_9CAUD|nr:hypothetical protein H1O15_gp019 [Achromobacter phage Motura]QDH83427.1 hypothetical protein [Achromobacter phage Motura]
MIVKLLELLHISHEEFLQRSCYTEAEFNSWGEINVPRQAYVIANLIAANRNLQQAQRTVIHIAAGDENWTPSSEEQQQLARDFFKAMNEGTPFTTRNGVKVTPVQVGVVNNLIVEPRGDEDTQYGSEAERAMGGTAGAGTVITAGDETWQPTQEQLEQLVKEFKEAEYDPNGGWVRKPYTVISDKSNNP